MSVYNASGLQNRLTGIHAMNSAIMGYEFGSSSSVSDIFGSAWQKDIARSLSPYYNNGGDYGKNRSVTGAETKEYVSDIKEYSNQLLKAAEKMTSKFPPLFKAMEGALKNDTNEKGTLDVTGVNSTVANKNRSLDVNVKQTASAQQNIGNSVKSADKVAQSGAFGFDVNIGGKTYGFNVNIGKNDNNLTAQMRMADAINKRGIGVNAYVSHDTKTGESFLTVQSDKTGEDQGFSITDRNANGLIQGYGVGTADTEAQNVVYSVNGGMDIESASNKVNLGNGVSATLKNAGQVNVGLKTDTDSILGGVKDFVEEYNNLLETAKDYDSTGSDKIVSQLTKAFKSYSSGLERAGITADKDGTLRIDEERARESIDDGSMAKAFGFNGYSSSGFSMAVKQTARSVDSTPNMYIGTQNSYERQRNNGFDFRSFGYDLYGGMTGYGLLFDSMF